MRFIQSNSENIFFNLATEEYLLRNSSENICIIWISEPSVVIGKHQNANAEINALYLEKNNIKVARRISGGGTVYHDRGNVNFTFIENGVEGKLVNFKKHLKPIVEFLSTLGLEAVIGKTNDLRINNLKISGNAEHVYRKRVLHHGTLLFNSDLEHLNTSIKVTPGKYTDKAVQSKRAHVANISDFLVQKVSTDNFTTQLFQYLNKKKAGIDLALTEEENIKITALVNEKFNSIAWNYGYSPKYCFKNSFNLFNLQFEIYFEVKKGIIENVQILSDDSKLNSELSKLLMNEYHHFQLLKEKLQNNSLESFLMFIF